MVHGLARLCPRGPTSPVEQRGQNRSRILPKPEGRSTRFCPPYGLHEVRSASISRIVFCELVLEFLHSRSRIDADLADIVGPGLLQWLGGLLPLRELSVRERINVVACL